MKLPVTTAYQLDNSELAALTDFAIELAELAGQAILPHFRSAIAIDHKPGRGYFDPVTIADRAAETVMRSHIRKHFPEHGILGEEHGYEPGTSGLTWVLDPIDGTRAFITGMPLWGTLIALYDGNKPIVGIVDQPVMKERYIGSAAGAKFICSGATSVLQTRRCEKIADAVLMATSPDIFESGLEQQAFNELTELVKMTRYGGDCYAYCMLACGFVDIIVESGLEPYDIQALIPIIENAGGVVSDWQGNSAVGGGQVMAVGNRALHKALLQNFAALGY